MLLASFLAFLPLVLASRYQRQVFRDDFASFDHGLSRVEMKPNANMSLGFGGLEYRLFHPEQTLLFTAVFRDYPFTALGRTLNSEPVSRWETSQVYIPPNEGLVGV